MTRGAPKPAAAVTSARPAIYSPRVARKVGLILDSAYDYGRGIIVGATSYAIAAGWRLQRHVVTIWSLDDSRPDMNVDGVIAMIYSPRFAQQLRRWNVPVVNVATAYEPTGFPSVVTDSMAVGRMAAAHFIERGFVHLAVVYSKRTQFAHHRFEGFVAAAKARSITPHEFSQPISGLETSATPKDLIEGERQLKEWLLSLPRPVGIFCVSDGAGATVIDAAHDIGRHVPEELAVLGTDDDSLIVNACLPMMSSVQMPSYAVGYEAAQLLEKLMAGEPAQENLRLFQPLGITVRASSEILAIDDPDVVIALRFIRDNVAAGIGVEDILRVVPLSRRPLERKFKGQLQRTILDEIHRSRIERAKTLLASTKLSMSAVAAQSGFQSATNMGTVFKQGVGMTPTAFKRQFGKA